MAFEPNFISQYRLPIANNVFIKELANIVHVEKTIHFNGWWNGFFLINHLQKRNQLLSNIRAPFLILLIFVYRIGCNATACYFIVGNGLNSEGIMDWLKWKWNLDSNFFPSRALETTTNWIKGDAVNRRLCSSYRMTQWKRWQMIIAIR